jgi:amino acid transporter
MKLGYKTAWLLLLLAVVATFIFIFVPVWLIQPFAPQTTRSIEISYFLKSWSPIVTVILAILAVALAVFIWSRSRRWFAKAALIVPLLLIVVFTWFAWQNHFEWMFNPLGNTQFARVNEVDFLPEDEMVLAVKLNGEAAAFPVTFMGYHHIAQAVVGGTPITATY